MVIYYVPELRSAGQAITDEATICGSFWRLYRVYQLWYLPRQRFYPL